jgi:signal transduction histidine kinase
MHELVEHSLALARFASNVELRLQTVRLSDIVDEIAAEAGADAEQGQVRLIVNVRDGAEVVADPRLLRSAASNLVRNAVKFTHEGGTVEVRAHVAGERATIEVEDACGGLPPGMVEKAFAPFVQLDASRGGFGLGLAIAKQAAEAHRGAIRVQNLPGKGCIFVLDLPAGGPV